MIRTAFRVQRRDTDHALMNLLLDIDRSQRTVVHMQLFQPNSDGPGEWVVVSCAEDPASFVVLDAKPYTVPLEPGSVAELGDAGRIPSSDLGVTRPIHWLKQPGQTLCGNTMNGALITVDWQHVTCPHCIEINSAR